MSTKFSIVSHIRNEEEIIPYYIQHWRDRVDCAYIIDDGPSTDATAKLLKEVGWQVVPNESDEWDSALIDRLCRAQERKISGWVVTVTVDEFIYPSRDELIAMLDQAESDGFDFVKTDGYHVIQHPDETFEPGKRFEDQFFWGVSAYHVSRVIHRNQNSAEWEYSPGRHTAPPGEMHPTIHPLLGDHRGAPKELSVRRRMVDASRVGEIERGAGRSKGKVNLTVERIRKQDDDLLQQAKKFRG